MACNCGHEGGEHCTPAAFAPRLSTLQPKNDVRLVSVVSLGYASVAHAGMFVLATPAFESCRPLPSMKLTFRPASATASSAAAVFCTAAHDTLRRLAPFRHCQVRAEQPPRRY